MPYVEASVRSRQFVAAARTVMSRDGVASTSLRAVAAESAVPLGTLQYVFPTKDLLLRAVVDDVVDDVARLLQDSVEVDRGLAHAIREGMTGFWSNLVVGQINDQIMQHELLTYLLRQPGHQDIARTQYARYASVIAAGCRAAAETAGEVCAVPFDRLARTMLAGVDGLIVQYMSDPDTERAAQDLDSLIEMFVAIAAIRPA
jgi:TetR/AcrR family transcriptional regulator, regulator of biofilm formation and stress response